ncbi:MAG TPA: substrate-binding domain-containing protein, partial [Polyangiaceae bacterium]|nr:substrate-binding domain-containing protein [Polyangiaceae bacterium]
VASSPASAAGSLTYLGTGSGNGEKCLRGQPLTFNNTTFCRTNDQSIVPMTRDLAGCQPGEVSHRIALDAIGIWSGQGQTISDLSLGDVRNAFCGTDGSGSEAACTVKTWGSLSKGASSAVPSDTIMKYRPDDGSDTTDTFMSTLNQAGFPCAAFCSDVKVVVDAGAGPKLSTDGTTSSLQPPCTSSEGAAACLARFSAGSSDVLGLASISAIANLAVESSGGGSPIPLPKALSVDGKTPTAVNIRNLITAPSDAYPFTRFLYFNENVNNPRSAGESKFFDWAFARAPFGTVNTSLTFETDLTRAGFIACRDPAVSGHRALDCGPSGCP